MNIFIKICLNMTIEVIQKATQEPKLEANPVEGVA
jgi:hypothetical protein